MTLHVQDPQQSVVKLREVSNLSKTEQQLRRICLSVIIVKLAFILVKAAVV